MMWTKGRNFARNVDAPPDKEISREGLNPGVGRFLMFTDGTVHTFVRDETALDRFMNGRSSNKSTYSMEA